MWPIRACPCQQPPVQVYSMHTRVNSPYCTRLTHSCSLPSLPRPSLGSSAARTPVRRPAAPSEDALHTEMRRDAVSRSTSTAIRRCAQCQRTNEVRCTDQQWTVVGLLYCGLCRTDCSSLPREPLQHCADVLGSERAAAAKREEAQLRGHPRPSTIGECMQREQEPTSEPFCL